MTEQESKQLLLAALSFLDGKLAEAESNSVEVRIVGGFALILPGARTQRFLGCARNDSRGALSHLATD
ncbi:MAG: hypothetical protein LBL86_05245 [Coriobacteriales bacterium]|jgi:hypothetical protein|nr:hypothetical protein [Coriobacteriales bacterium]